MSAPETCAGCRFWRVDTNTAATDGADFAFGHCRRAPPRIIDCVAQAIMPAPSHFEQVDPEMSTTTLSIATLFPATHTSDWCGEFAPSVEVLAI